MLCTIFSCCKTDLNCFKTARQWWPSGILYVPSLDANHCQHSCKDRDWHADMPLNMLSLAFQRFAEMRRGITGQMLGHWAAAMRVIMRVIMQHLLQEF